MGGGVPYEGPLFYEVTCLEHTGNFTSNSFIENLPLGLDERVAKRLSTLLSTTVGFGSTHE